MEGGSGRMSARGEVARVRCLRDSQESLRDGRRQAPNVDGHRLVRVIRLYLHLGLARSRRRYPIQLLKWFLTRKGRRDGRHRARRGAALDAAICHYLFTHL